MEDWISNNKEESMIEDALLLPGITRVEVIDHTKPPQ
jgi:hypothetical protein